MNTFDVKETNESIMPASGLAIVGAILTKFHFIERFNARYNPGKRSGKCHYEPRHVNLRIQDGTPVPVLLHRDHRPSQKRIDSIGSETQSK